MAHYPLSAAGAQPHHRATPAAVALMADLLCVLAMLRFLFRAFGLLLLACAFAAVIVDGTRSIAADGPVFTTIGQAVAGLAPAKLPLLEAAADQIHPLLRKPGLTVLLAIPLWVLAGVIGGALLAVTRPRRPMIGFSSR